MSSNQRKLLFAVAASTLVVGLQSLASGADNIKQQVEREKILRHEQPKTQNTLAPKGGSTGPTVPPKPTQGNVHR